tara:strand:- start:3750 stop:4145 length:396 start_codon:yes stop_codon:yes gene_type:complete
MKKKKKCKKKSNYRKIPKKISDYELKKIISENKQRDIKNIDDLDPIKTIKNYEKEINSFIEINLKEKDFPWIFFKKTVLFLISELIKPHDHLIENINSFDSEKLETYIKDKSTLVIALNLIKNVYVGKYDI